MELAELRRANERLLKQLDEARNCAKRGGTKEDDDDADEDGGEVERARDERIKVLQANLKSVVAIFGEEAPESIAKKEELDALLKTRREGRPLKTQLQNADRRIERHRAKVGKLDALVGDICTRISDLRDELDKAESDLAEARTQLEVAEDERKALLLREAQSEKDASPPPAARASHGEAEWAQLVSVIKERADQPGVQNELTTQIGTVLDMLRSLCWQLPSPPAAAQAAAPAAAAGPSGAGEPGPGQQQQQQQPQPSILSSTQPAASAAAATAASPTTSAAPAAVEAEENARAAAREIAQQIRRDMAASAAARRQQKEVQQDAEQRRDVPTHPVFVAAGGGTTTPAEAAPLAAQPQSASQGDARAGTEAVPATPVAEPVEAAESTAFDSLDEVSSVADEEDVHMLDATLASLPDEQRAKVRELLDKRRYRTAQRRSGPKRLKRAGKQREAVGDSCTSKKHQK